MSLAIARVILFLCFVFFWLAPFNKVNAASWLSGWTYRKQITLTGQSGASTDFQVKLKVGESSGSAGADFNLGGASAATPSAKNVGGDLRFTASDGTTLQNFWVESVSGSAPNRTATIWVKVSADLSSNQNIYVYYGNSGASNASSGANTFLLFDDFDGASYNTNVNWSLSAWTGSSVSVASSQITFTSGAISSGKNYVWLTSPSTFTYPVWTETKVDSFSPNGATYRMGATTATTPRSDNGNLYNEYSVDALGAAGYRIVSDTSVGGYQNASTGTSINDTSGIWSFAWVASNSQKFYLNYASNLSATGGNGISIANYYMYLGNATNAVGTSKVDWARVRKYLATEPSYSSAASQEIQTTFSYTGADQSFTVPASVTSITVKMWGGGGGGYGSGWGSSALTGGGGGFAQATLSVTPGEILTVVTGGGGRPYPNYSAYGGGGKGYGSETTGGGDYGGSGGGRSEIRRSTTPLVVAGGGGGCGANTGGCNKGGAGGGTSGQYANNSSSCLDTPGDQSSYSPTGANGATTYAGGGGGGYKGGGGGRAAVSGSYAHGGAGGSGYVTGTSTTLTTGSLNTAGNSTDSDRNNAGTGGAWGGNGGNGLVLISYASSPTSDASLSNLTISSGTLSPAFASATTAYTASVTNATSSITVTPTVNQVGATVKVNGTGVTSGAPSGAISLAVGTNIINVVSSAIDSTSKTYTITVTRQQSTDATLSALTLSSGTLSPVFAADTTTYTASVTNATSSITITPTINQSNATIKVNGTTVTSGAASGAISLSVGANTLTTVVTAADNSTTKTYTVTVTRQQSVDATLSALTINTGTLSPVFSANTTSYSVTVSNATSNVIITPTSAQANAIIKINNNNATSSAGHTLPISIGNNSATIVVTAPDTSTTKTYTISIVRDLSGDATLSNLVVSQGSLTPAFSATTSAYTNNVSNEITSLAITPTTNGVGATVKVNGTTVASGSASDPLSLVVGANTVTILVTAQNLTTNTYTITVNRAISTDATLSALTLSSGTLSPVFAADTTTYTASVDNAVSSVTITPTTSQSNATIKINDTNVTSATGYTQSLSVGSKTINVIVTAPDNSTTKTYTITVTRQQSTDATLSALTLSSGTLSPVFAADTTTYTASVDNAVSSVTITPTKTQTNSTIKINHTNAASGAGFSQSLAIDANTISIVVTAPDGTTTKTYTITITRAGDPSAPVISNAATAQTNSAGTITWTTANKDASTLINYGLTSSVTSQTTEIDTSTRVANHTATISGLISCAKYYYKIQSQDSSGNIGYGSLGSFNTSGCTGGATITDTGQSSITAASGGTLSTGNISLSIPASFTSSADSLEIQANKLDNATFISSAGNPAGKTQVGTDAYNLTAFVDPATIVSSFDAAISVTLSYTANQISGINEASLQIYRHDGSQWNALSSCSVDTVAKTVTCTTTAFSTFSLFGQTSSTVSTTNNSSSPNAPSCSQTAPTGSPDLFEIKPSQNTVTLFFTPVTGSSEYVVRYGTTPDANQYGATFSHSDTSGAVKYDINNLQTNTKYYFAVRAGNGCATGNWSKILSATTGNQTPVIPLTTQKIVEKIAEKAAEIPIVEKVVDKKIEVKKVEVVSKPEEVSYVVKAGDTLWSIAKDILGEGSKYAEIAKQNLLANLKLNIGQKLTIEKKTPPVNKMFDLDVKILASTGKPLQGVEVTLMSTPRKEKTGDDGVAHFKNVEEGQHHVYLAYGSYDGGGQAINVTGESKNVELIMQVDLKAGFSPSKVITAVTVLVLLNILLVAFIISKRNKLWKK